MRYYTEKVTPPGRGYLQLPGVKEEIARLDLNLQILKGYLRVGDTYALGLVNSSRVKAKTILCGDKGMALFLLNENFQATEDVPPLVGQLSGRYRWRFRFRQPNTYSSYSGSVKVLLQFALTLRRIHFLYDNCG